MRTARASRAQVGRVLPRGANPVVVGALLPCVQASISGIGAGALAGTLARLAYSPQDALSAAALVASGVFCLTWGILLRASGNRLPVYDVAMPTRADRRLVLLNPADPPEPGDQVGRFCQFVKAASVDTSTRRLVGLGFTRDDIERFRVVLMRQGYASWRGRDRRRGWMLTADPDDVLGALAG